MTTRKAKRVKGDRFILCRFSLRCGPMVDESSNNLAELFGQIPVHLCEGDDEKLSVCEVGYWTINVPGDPFDSTPREVTILYEIEHYADCSEAAA